MMPNELQQEKFLVSSPSQDLSSFVWWLYHATFNMHLNSHISQLTTRAEEAYTRPVAYWVQPAGETRLLCSRVHCMEDSNSSPDSHWNSSVEHSAKLSSGWLCRYPVVLPIGSVRGCNAILVWLDIVLTSRWHDSTESKQADKHNWQPGASTRWNFSFFVRVWRL